VPRPTAIPAGLHSRCRGGLWSRTQWARAAELRPAVEAGPPRLSTPLQYSPATFKELLKQGGLIAQTRSGKLGPGSESRRWRRSDDRHPQAPRRLHRDPRAVSRIALFSAGYIIIHQGRGGGTIPLIEAGRPFEIKGRVLRRSGGHAGPGPDGCAWPASRWARIGDVTLKNGVAVVTLRHRAEVQGRSSTSAPTPSACCGPRHRAQGHVHRA